ncbi:SDR family oxidoreductase [Alicyclobacillus cycloheptanicus]|uniref:NAD(P)-dependent dehydrogenase (Short-subunit alcohol dehydrogenase family) n=1 Tax=Alicyclobacillus cycloheptanicus TaxID=1457 RepID=A0ABT9XLC9_9BACL|nr:SDR family oxidoreductase [Alicyclobacillus cycloheptanicus]MDQ0191027.1 NAD(P)-dependent dehydrogenase (short-subunit alcohol dehydrogenase family) [Alicyclobacillus cycloheptanicus]
MAETMLPKGTLSGRTAVVTGGGSGIGFGIASELARLGATVVLAGRKQERLEAAAQEIQTAGGQALAVPTDIRDPEQVDHLMNTAVEQTGRLDILVNNAAGNFIVDSDKLSVNGWNSVVNTVLNGTFYCTRAAGLKMIELGNGGRMLSVVASYAWTGGPRTVHSVAAKAGVIAMTKTLGVEWAHYGIRVNAICPGPTDTEGARPLWADPEEEKRLKAKIPVGRFGTVQEMAQAASYLLSPYADFVNGEVFVIDGGEWLGKGLTS